MLKLRKNDRNDLYIYFTRCDIRKLIRLTAKFQEDPIEPQREIDVGKKLGVNAVLPMLCSLRLSKSFQSDNHVYYDLNNSTLDFFI